MSDGPTQLGLFGGEEPVGKKAPRKARAKPKVPAGKVEAAVADDDVTRIATELAPTIHLGTSSWSFPGWQGIVYDRKATERTLARNGLAAYARHPLLRSVGIDRTYYEPIDAPDFAAYADAVPDDFRFLVKAHELVTVAKFARYGRYAQRAGQVNELFFDALYTTARIVEPAVEGLGAKLGPIVFQLPPQGLARDGAERFAGQVHTFLSALPKGPLYAIEIRERGLFSEDYLDALADTGAVHCVSVHPGMPAVAEQGAKLNDDHPVVVRWMLNGGLRYEEARDRYAPFDRLVDQDLESRTAIADLCSRASRAGNDAFIIANNKAEGSAPLTLVELARRIVDTD